MKDYYLNFKNLMFFLGLLLLEMSYVVVNVVGIQSYLRVIKLFSFVLLLLSFLLTIRYDLYSKNKLFVIFVILAISLIVFVKYEEPLMLEIALVSVNCAKINFKTVVKYDLIIKLFLLFFIIFFHMLGLTNGDYEKIMRDDTIRSSLGFFHPNTLSMFSMIIIFEYLYLNKLKLTTKKIFLAVLSSIIFSKITDSRTALYCTVILIVISIFYRKKLDQSCSINKFLKFVISNSFFVFLVFSILISVMYLKNSLFAIKLNESFNNRISYQSLFFRNYGVTLLGNNIEYNITLDNGYLKLLLNFGIIPTIIYLFTYLLNFQKGLQKDFLYVVILEVVLLYSLFESSMLYVSYNIFFLYIFCSDDCQNKIVWRSKWKKKKLKF